MAQTLGIIPSEELGEEGVESAMGGPQVGLENLVFSLQLSWEAAQQLTLY